MSRSRRTTLRTSIAIGVVVTLLLTGAGVAYALLQPRGWLAESMVVVLPSTELDEATSASYYETLSRGQIVATFAEVAGSLRFEQQAEDRLGLSPAQRAAAGTEVSVVPDTAVILVRSTADDAAVAQQLSSIVTELSVTYLAGLSEPFRAVPVPSGTGAAEPTGTSPLVLAGAGVVAGLVAGLAVQQAVYHLVLAARGRSADPTTGVGPDQPPDPDPDPVLTPGPSLRADPGRSPVDEQAGVARRGVAAPS